MNSGAHPVDRLDVRQGAADQNRRRQATVFAPKTDLPNLLKFMW
jgi:hypothetical protein